MTRMWRPAIGGLILAMLLLPAAVAAQTAPSVEPSRVVKVFIQEGLYGCCEGEGAGFVQYRIVRLNDNTTLGLLLGGVTF